MRVSASRELVAPRGDVWRFVSEPFHLADWWPGLRGVSPDRRGLAAGARWTVTFASSRALLRTRQSSGLLLIRRVVAQELVAWHSTAERLDVELVLTVVAADRTLATLTVEGRWLPEVLLPRRRLPAQALARLHALCQTAASL